MGENHSFLRATLYKLHNGAFTTPMCRSDSKPESAFQYANPEAHIHAFRSFLDNFHLLTLNLPIVEKFAEVRAYLRRRGQLVSDFDILLGATALHYDLIVLTYNKKHFERIPDIKIHQS